jgi:hypothetical protein
MMVAEKKLVNHQHLSAGRYGKRGRLEARDEGRHLAREVLARGRRTGAEHREKGQEERGFTG